MRPAFLFLSLALLAGCPDRPAPPAARALPAPSVPDPPAPVATGTPLANVTQLVPLDAIDNLTLPSELAATIADARSRVPERLDSKERAALEDLESRYERSEADMASSRDRARLLGAYYWERLRIFSRELPEDPPEEMLSAFERGTGRND